MRRNRMHALLRAYAHSFALIAALGACSRQGAAGDAKTDTTSASTQAAIGVSSAESRLAAFLSASLEGSAKVGNSDTLRVCTPDGAVEPLLALADFRILSSSGRGDTVDAAALITTVAEEKSHPKRVDYYLTTVDVRQDTARWKMVRSGPAHAWTVCGISNEATDFGHYGNDRNTSFLPQGMSWSKIDHLADSIHQTHHR